MLEIDGSRGEGGGQILRSSLALSLVLERPFRITAIRAKRKKPGLLRQHLTAVEAAAAIGRADVSGAELGSSELVFRPRPVTGGWWRFAVGTAGSATLVLQTVLVPLLLAPEPSELVLEGGTHNPLAPPFPFLEAAFAPLLRRMGAGLDLALDRPGFFPAGGGRFTAKITPGPLGRLELPARGALRRRIVRAVLSEIPGDVATREIATLLAALGWKEKDVDARPDAVRSRGPGNVLLVTLESEHVTEVVASFGERGVRAERVAERCADEVRRYLGAEVPVSEHLADQLLLPMALGGGGVFRTLKPSLHFETQRETLAAFLGVEIGLEEEAPDRWLVTVPERRR